MGEKLVVGPVNKGLQTNRLPFVIDNDSFPVLNNAYQWRGRILRKRGTSLLNRLKRYFDSTSTAYNPDSATLTLDGSGNGNLLTGYSGGFSLQADGNIVPGSVTITAPGPTVYTDPAMDGTLSPSGTINYASGEITIAAEANNAVTVTFNYYPVLPVMGLEDFVLSTQFFPGTIGFDTTYSYNILPTFPYNIYDVSFYKNPVADPTNLPGYIPKTTVTATSWNGENYQQFWTTNYQGAMWATNGIDTPFTGTHIGMQFKPIVTTTVTAGGPPAIVTLQITGHGLVVGDFLFINEVVTTTGINFQTGYVIAVIDPDNVSVEFPNATIATNGTGGIAQYLTNRSDPTKDCLRWYDGDPTNGNATTPTLNGHLGWVNFSPPLLSPLFDGTFSVADLPPAIYYLIGARMIVPFKDRLLFIAPVIQTGSVGATPIYLPDTIIYSQNGTAYYTASFTGDPTLATTVFHPILTPTGQTAAPNAYWEDQTGFGGFVQAGVDQEILTVGTSLDVLILGLKRMHAQLVYSGNDLIPFLFYTINSELGASSTFSAINMDQGVMSRGNRGFVMTDQRQTQRIDLEIPDDVFQIDLGNNGAERITAQRDYINEWIYFTYRGNESQHIFPSETLQYNYRDQSWGKFFESYTTYGSFRRATGFTWATVGTVYPTWNSWNEPWNAGTSTLLQPEVIAGNQQGFVLFRDDGTNEANSISIKNISYPVSITGISQANPAVITANNQFMVGQQIRITNVVGMTEVNNNVFIITAVSPTTITIDVDSTLFTPYISGGLATPLELIYSPNHGLNNGDYIVISGALGTVAPIINGKIYSVVNPTVNGFFLLDGTSSIPTDQSYLGGGLIKRMYVPFIQTKQFPLAWALGRKTRIGVQQYLFSKTNLGQITLLIFLSQDGANAYNRSPIVPDPNSINDSLIYSTILFTCPESTNLGLTPANINLNMVTGSSQAQIWHRMNTSLIGDTVQIGFTLSDAQMRDIAFKSQFSEIELHGFILDVTPSQLLA